MKPLGTDFFAARTLTVARRLVGATLTRGPCSGVIVEVEAYTDDPASHHVTRPRKSALMRETHGFIYVYQIYGVHHCLNFTTDAHGVGAVLVRALEPLAGLEVMRRRRGVERITDLCSGPAKLVQALGISPALNGRPVIETFTLVPPDTRPRITASPRIGIAAAKDLPWRFTLTGSRFVSRPVPASARGIRSSARRPSPRPR